MDWNCVKTQKWNWNWVKNTEVELELVKFQGSEVELGKNFTLQQPYQEQINKVNSIVISLAVGLKSW
jgi:hypothetical protein